MRRNLTEIYKWDSFIAIFQYGFYQKHYFCHFSWSRAWTWSLQQKLRGHLCKVPRAAVRRRWYLASQAQVLQHWTIWCNQQLCPVPGSGVRKLTLSLPTSSLCTLTVTRKRLYITTDDDLDFQNLRMVTMTQPTTPVWGRMENVTLKLISASGMGGSACSFIPFAVTVTCTAPMMQKCFGTGYNPDSENHIISMSTNLVHCSLLV